MTATVDTSIDIQPLTPRIGAVLEGVDLGGPLGDETVGLIRKALLDHRVVFFRNQRIDSAGQIAFAQRLGPLTHAHPTLPSTEEVPELFDIDSRAGASANHWHTDVTFVERPPAFSVLRSVIIPPVGGDTLWANTVTGYEDLRPDLRTLADSLRAVHSNGNDYGRADVAARGGSLSEERLNHLKTFVSTVYETEHPVVRIHPETCEPALLLGGFAQRLVGHPTYESLDILRTLQSYVVRPENTVRWRWRMGDVVVWDNRSTEHYAVADYAPQRRRTQRVTTDGDVAVGLDGSISKALKGDASSYYRAA